MSQMVAAQASKQAQSTPASSTGVLQRRCDKCRKKKPLLQRAAAGPTSETVPPIVHEVLRSHGAPLDATTRAFMEPRFGHDFSRVRVHTDAKAAESARAVHAQAYTVGQNIVFGPGHSSPHSQAGRRLLAHELVHTLQQAVVPATHEDTGSLSVSKPGDCSEREADQASDQALAGKSVAIQPASCVPGILARAIGGGSGATTRPPPASPPTPSPAPPAALPARAVTPRGPNPADCMAPLCERITRPPAPRTDDELRRRADEWLAGSLACVRGGAAGSNASHAAEIQVNNEQELQESRDAFVQDFNNLPQAQRNRLRGEAPGWLAETCRRSHQETHIEFHYNVVFENPRGGLRWGLHPAEWSSIEGALAALPAEATWMNPLLLRFRRQACHPDNVDPGTGQCAGSGTGASRSFIGGETDLQTGRITAFTPGLGQAPYSRSERLGLSRTFQTLRHEVGHVVISQIPSAARGQFFEQIVDWRTYPWHWINVRQALPGTAPELRSARSRLCTELGFIAGRGGCDDGRLDQWLNGIALDQAVQLGGRTYVRRTSNQRYLDSIRTDSLPQGMEFEYARTAQEEYLAELYTLAVSRPEFLHDVLPDDQIAWLKQNVFRTPSNLARMASFAPEAANTELLVRGSRLFTWEQLDALLNELTAKYGTPGGKAA